MPLLMLDRGKEAPTPLEDAAAAVELLPAQPRRLPGQPKVDLEVKDVYDRLVALYMAEHRPEDTFLATERCRSRGFEAATHAVYVADRS